jgi:hypothetical protein
LIFSWVLVMLRAMPVPSRIGVPATYGLVGVIRFPGRPPVLAGCSFWERDRVARHEGDSLAWFLLPAGLEATDAGDDVFGEVVHGQWQCMGKTVVTCTSNMVFTAGSVTAGAPAPIAIALKVAEDAEPGEAGNEMTISGGGGATVGATDQLTIGSQPAKFGFAHLHAWFSNADGTLDTQAGSHPYEMTIAFDLNAVKYAEVAGGEARNIDVNLPPGLVGNPTAVPRCVRRMFDAKHCSVDTQIGVATVYTEEEVQILQLYDLVPPPGVAAQFGLSLEGIQVVLNATVRSGGDYGITTRALDVPERGVVSSSVTIWGIPSDSSHDRERKSPTCSKGGCSSGATPAPFLTLPTACEAGQVLSVSANNWRDEDLVREASVPVGFTGCDHPRSCRSPTSSCPSAVARKQRSRPQQRVAPTRRAAISRRGAPHLCPTCSVKVAL